MFGKRGMGMSSSGSWVCSFTAAAILGGDVKDPSEEFMSGFVEELFS